MPRWVTHIRHVFTFCYRLTLANAQAGRLEVKKRRYDALHDLVTTFVKEYEQVEDKLKYRRTQTYVAPTYVDLDLRKKLLVPLPPPHPPLPLPQLNMTVTPVSIINYY
jgi:hypothetical protein